MLYCVLRYPENKSKIVLLIHVNYFAKIMSVNSEDKLLNICFLVSRNVLFWKISFYYYKKIFPRDYFSNYWVITQSLHPGISLNHKRTYNLPLHHAQLCFTVLTGLSDLFRWVDSGLQVDFWGPRSHLQWGPPGEVPRPSLHFWGNTPHTSNIRRPSFFAIFITWYLRQIWKQRSYLLAVCRSRVRTRWFLQEKNVGESPV